MEVIKLTSNQIDLLKSENDFLKLNYDLGKNAIWGVLSFNLQFGNDGETIIDEYQIEIDLNNVSDLGIPIVKETANRIFEIAKQKDILPQDLHLNNENGEMCIIIPPKIKERYPNGFDLVELLKHLQEHLYWISYFEKYNKKPWPEYGHNDLGYLELYIEDKKSYSNYVKEYFQCNSRHEFRRKIKKLRKQYKV